MSNRELKPKRTSEELVTMMKYEKGIRFERMSEAEAISYLKYRNNYMRTAAYRKNYPKHTSGESKGKYILLDFMDLVTLSALDKELRMKFIQMCIDVEHAMQIKLLQELEENGEDDGYQLVEDFLEENPYVRGSLERNSGGVYTQSLFYKYFTVEEFEVDGNMRKLITDVDCPIWVLLELLTFGDLLKFFTFYRNKYPQDNTISKNLLNMVRSLRNACAHNNCLLVSLAPSEGTHPPAVISQYTSRELGLSKEERYKRLSNRPLLEITSLFYVYGRLVSADARARMQIEWQELISKTIDTAVRQLESNAMVTTSLRYITCLARNLH